MKKIGRGSLWVLVALVCLTGCLERQFAEETKKISVDRQELVVPSDSELGVDCVKDTIWVSSNRTWMASFAEEVDWVTMEGDGHYDFGKVTEKTPVFLSFNDNPEKTERSVRLVISSEAGKQEVLIRQKAINYRLSCTNDPEDFQNLTYERDTVALKIMSNTEWNVSMKDGSGVAATFSKTSGSRSDEILAYFDENPDQVAKTGFIVLSSPNCASVEIPVSQIKAKPYLKSLNGDVVTAFDGIDNFVFPIKTNSNWTASITSVSGYDQAAVSVTASGDKDAKEVEVKFPASIDFDKQQAQIEVTFTVEGAEKKPVKVQVQQVPALRYCFGDPYTEALHSRQDVMYTAADTSRIHKNFWPFATCKEVKTPEVTHGDGFKWLASTRVKDGTVLECTTRNGGYVAHFCGKTKGIGVTGTYGMAVGSEVGAYVGAPVVPGRKLVKVDFWLHSNALYGEVQTFAGVRVSGGELTVSKTGTWNIVCNLEGTEAGVEYRVGLYKAGYWLRTSDIIFYYE